MAVLRPVEEGRMSFAQIVAVAITVGLNALDGFDVLAISFAAPGIADEWNIQAAALGVVLSAELFGMALGSILIGGVADRIGRRPTILGCLIAMAIGMYMVSTVHSIAMLGFWRVLTGLGIGGMLAAINAVAAEFSNRKWRPVAMALMVIGYPIGAVIGGSFAGQLLADGSWRDVFAFGAIVTACFIPLVVLLVPESPSYLAAARPPNALKRINRTLTRFGAEELVELPEEVKRARRKTVKDLFGAGFGRLTMFLSLAYFAHIVAFYFILKWVPKIVVDMGHAPDTAAGVLVWANIGGAAGGALFGLIAARAGLLRTTIAALLLSFGMVSYFGGGQDDPDRLNLVVCMAGFCTNAAIVGLYTIMARAYPTDLRASGTGFVIGVGRGGSAFAPILAGFLFAGGFGLQAVAFVMGGGSLIAAAALLLSRFGRGIEPPLARVSA